MDHARHQRGGAKQENQEHHRPHPTGGRGGDKATQQGPRPHPAGGEGLRGDKAEQDDNLLDRQGEDTPDATSISHGDFVKMSKPDAPLMPVCMESRRGMHFDK